MKNKKRVAYHSFGCKLNFAETSYIISNFDKNNFDIVSIKNPADYFIINTCSVTSVASSKCKSLVKNIAKKNPNSTICIIGCDVYQNQEFYKDIPQVKYILGNENKVDLSSLVQNNDIQLPYHSVTEINKTKKFQFAYSGNQRTRVFLKVQDGCDYFCSYCLIPFLRGRSRSDTIEKTVQNAKKVLETGIKEIVLTGVNIGDFGKNNNETFYNLLIELSKISNLKRLRISSIEPELLTKDIIDLVAQSKNIMPHFHIPLQSGSDAVLADMKRKYDTKLFAEKVSYIKKVIPDAYIAADVIVGFPTETDKLFNDTYNFINSLDITDLHVFPYSDREGTQSIKSAIKNSQNVKKARHNLLEELANKKKDDFYNKHIGKKAEILWEAEKINNETHGFSCNYIKAKTKFDINLINTITEVVLEDVDNQCFTTKLL